VSFPNFSRGSLALFAGVLLVSLAAGPSFAAAPRPIVIRNVTLIDGRSAAAKDEMTVIISDRHFTTIAPAAQTKIPPDACFPRGSAAIDAGYRKRARISKTGTGRNARDRGERSAESISRGTKAPPTLLKLARFNRME
jgi:hypothetical protein